MKRILRNRFAAGTLLVTCVIALMSFGVPVSYQVGDAVADFSVKNVDGKMVSLSSMPAAKGVIVVFTCNHCPFAKKYEQRIIDLNAKYAAKGYPVLAISPNDPKIVEEDSYENMQKLAKEHKYAFPYAIDETQNVAKAFGATKTPHVFVVAKEGDKMVLKYMGAIDDNVDEPKAAKSHYVADAVEALLAGKPVTTTTTKSIGCGIKWRES
jgi:peroxiredoxin